jgi:hypothetical protein
MLEPNEVQTPPKVTFDAAQQSKVDELIRESMGRAASSVKAELFATQTRLTALHAELPAAKDAAAIATGDVAKAKDAEILKAREETVAVRGEYIIYDGQSGERVPVIAEAKPRTLLLKSRFGKNTRSTI